MPYAIFNRFEIELPKQTVVDCCHSGQCLEDVQYWASRIKRPDTITPEKLRAELKEYGAWDEHELSNDSDNWERIIWIAAGNIQDCGEH